MLALDVAAAIGDLMGLKTTYRVGGADQQDGT